MEENRKNEREVPLAERERFVHARKHERVRPQMDVRERIALEISAAALASVMRHSAILPPEIKEEWGLGKENLRPMKDMRCPNVELGNRKSGGLKCSVCDKPIGEKEMFVKEDLAEFGAKQPTEAVCMKCYEEVMEKLIRRERENPIL